MQIFIQSVFIKMCNRELQKEKKHQQTYPPTCFRVKSTGANIYPDLTDNRYLHSSIMKIKVNGLNKK